MIFKEKRKKIIFNIFSLIFIILGIFILLLYNFINLEFPAATPEQLIFSLQTADGTGSGVIKAGAKYIVPLLLRDLFILLLFILFFKFWFKNKINLNLKFKNKIKKISLVPVSNSLVFLISILFFIISLFSVLNNLGIVDYFMVGNSSTYIEENYVDPKEVDIVAPKKKNNLIYIYVESLETTFFDSDNGGNYKESVIPNLESLAADNISFSRTSKNVGALNLYDTTWTIAGMVASTSGLTFKIVINHNVHLGKNGFLPGAYTLGEILESNGYNNYLFIGSDGNFADRTQYFKEHGNYNIYDYNYAIKKKWIDSDYGVWWGYEDKKLYSFAKETLTEISKNDEPFNFTMLTADTHAPDGYLDASCKEIYDEKLLNSYACTDLMLNDFIKWLKKQDFYKNTTIIIQGDHLSMQGDLEDMYDVNSNERGVYNLYINSLGSLSNSGGK